MSTLRLENVSKSFADSWVVKDVSLRVESGELFTLLGPSGCGKTTILRMIAGFYFPTRGRIYFDGRDVTDLPPHRRGVGMVFQSYALFPHMTVYENVAFGLRLRRLNRVELDRRVGQALVQVGLGGYGRRRIDELSGGEQQRVALARALVIQPTILLLDEPLSNLDAKLREETRGEIRGLQTAAGITTIYVTHDQAEAMAMSDRIAVLSQGEVHQVGPPREIYEKPATRFVAGFIGKSSFVEGKVARRAGSSVLVQGDEVQLWCDGARRNLWVELNVGQRVTICIRPEAFRLARPGDPNVVRGRVTMAEYAGAHTRYRVRVGSLELVVDLPSVGGTTVRPGDELALSVPPDQVFILE